MQQAAQSSRTALTPEQLSQLHNKLSTLEKKLAETLQEMDTDAEYLESELSNLIKKQIMDTDDVQYVGLIKDCISYKEDIRTLHEWITKGLNDSDYDHNIIKAFGFTKPKLQPPNPSPFLKTVRDKQRENYNAQLINMPYKSELLELYELGMTDLSANLQAINKAKGNLEYACNFLFD